MNKKDRIRIYVILKLLYNNSLLTQDLKDLLNSDRNFKDLLNSDRNFKDLFNGDRNFRDGIDDATLSPVLNELRRDGIIERKSIIIEGKSGGNPTENNLIENYDVLTDILQELYWASEEVTLYSTLFKKRFIGSNYVRRLINENFLNYVEGKIQEMIDEQINGLTFKFIDHEKQLILNILRSSPAALYYATVTYKNDIMNKIQELRMASRPFINSEDDYINEIVKKFVLNLQIALGEDINQNIANIDEKNIEYKISVKFNGNKRLNKSFFEQNIDEDEVETIISRNTYHVIDNTPLF